MVGLLLAIGFAEARLYAPQPMAPVQYTTAGGYVPHAVAPASDAQLMYVSAMPVAETSTSGTSFISGIAFVAGLSVTFATLAHHVQKKATKHHHHSRPRKSRPSDINRKAPVYPEIPDIPVYTVLKKAATSDEAAPEDAAPASRAGEPQMMANRPHLNRPKLNKPADQREAMLRALTT